MFFSAWKCKVVLATGILILVCGGFSTLSAKKPESKKRTKKEAEAPAPATPRTFRVQGGVKSETTPGTDSLWSAAEGFGPADSLGVRPVADSTALIVTDSITGLTDTVYVAVEPPVVERWSRADSLLADSYGITLEELDLLREIEARDSQATAMGESAEIEPEVFLSRRERREMERAIRLADTTRTFSRIFRDSIPVSRLTLISTVLPGFGQLYNKQAWKIPILYGVVGTTGYFWMQERKNYQDYKSEYDYLMARNQGGLFTDEIDRVRRRMIKHNTAKQLWMVGAIGTYMYFLGDVAINYKGVSNNVKMATTLSTICPGAGQVYNKSYWKVPIVIGGIATFAMVIDWNNRGYKRYKDAYTFATDGDPNTENDLSQRYESDASFLKNMKTDFRRSRDLAIILAGVFYAVNIIDAHVDAHLKSYDISDDLRSSRVDVNLVPVMHSVSTQTTGFSQTMGLGLQITF